MKARMQITIETDVGPYVEEMACWERQAHRREDIGISVWGPDPLASFDRLPT
jgi:hypothetical protein